MSSPAPAADDARVHEAERVSRLLQSIVAGTRVLLDAAEFEPALGEWLRMMCQAQGATSAGYYDVVVHPESGMQTVRALAEWSPHQPGTHGRVAISFESPLVIDPRGGQALVDSLSGGAVMSFHTAELSGHTRSGQEAQGHATTIVAPILDGERWTGAVSFDYWLRKELNPQDEIILRTAADSLASVLKRHATQQLLRVAELGRREAEAAQLNAERERAVLLSSVQRASSLLLGQSRLGEAVGAAIGIIGQALHCDLVAIGQFLAPDANSELGWIDWKHDWYAQAPTGMRPVGMRMNIDDQRQAYACYRAGLSHMVGDLTQWAEPAAFAIRSTGARSCFGVPIRVRDRLWGKFTGACNAVRQWNEAEIETLMLFAAAIGATLEREQLEQARLDSERARAEAAEAAAAALSRRRDLLDAVVQISSDLLRANSLADHGQSIVQRLRVAMAADRAVIIKRLAPGNGSELGWYRIDFEAVPPGLRRQMDDPALRTMNGDHYVEFVEQLMQGRATQILTADIASDEGRHEQEQVGTLSQFVYPVTVDDELWGCLCCDDVDASRQWDADEIATLRLVASAVASIVKRERLTEQRINAERDLAEERSRMAREIHDTLAQGFTGVIMQLHSSADALELGDADDAGRHLGRALTRARMGLSEARRSVYTLRPPMLENGDLVGALRVAMERVFDGVPIKSELLVHGQALALDEGTAFELFRIAQEALSNAIRHAAATWVAIELHFGPGARMSLAVVDDGRGFVVDTAHAQGGFGLISMRERSRRLGAQLQISAVPGSGTRVELMVKLPHAAETRPSALLPR